MTKQSQIEELKKQLTTLKSRVLREEVKEKIKQLEANEGIQK